MKKQSIFCLLALTLLVGAFADIQSPPGHHFNWSRKLSRGVGNILYGWMEPFHVWQHTNYREGSTAAASDFIIEGPKRTIVRLAYGIYEVVTFPIPSYKCTYRPPYYRKEKIDPWWGYQEFAPQPGQISEVNYSRNQAW
jgi:putative exosortase-associated protein (TIGR04073 family)